MQYTFLTELPLFLEESLNMTDDGVTRLALVLPYTLVSFVFVGYSPSLFAHTTAVTADPQHPFSRDDPHQNMVVMVASSWTIDEIFLKSFGWDRLTVRRQAQGIGLIGCGVLLLG